MSKTSNFAYSSEELWAQAIKIGVQMAPDRVIVRGVVFQMEEGVLKLLSGQTTFYDPLPEEDVKTFLAHGVTAGVNSVMLKKYKGKVAKCDELILTEERTRRNQKRINYLKHKRDGYEKRIESIEG
jgi:hypothetical protein